MGPPPTETRNFQPSVSISVWIFSGISNQVEAAMPCCARCQISLSIFIGGFSLPRHHSMKFMKSSSPVQLTFKKINLFKKIVDKRHDLAITFAAKEIPYERRQHLRLYRHRSEHGIQPRQSDAGHASCADHRQRS